MIPFEASGLLIGAVALGAVHGIEPGHGWPVAASYALEKSHRWLYGLAASLIIGIGHLVSSIAMVALFFYAKSYFSLTQVDKPITLGGGVSIGGPVSVVAGLLLIGLGIREYRHGHSHGTHGGGDAHDHEHDHGHNHEHGGEQSHGHDHETTDSEDHDDESGGFRATVRSVIPFVGGGGHSHETDAADRGLLGIAWFAFLLGFAHEEEFEIIALCAGSDACLWLMSAYALTVIVGIVTLTLLLIAGYEHFQERVEQYVPYLPVVSATVLIVMGVGFVTGLI
ncbi:hypothetical protein [Halovenus halobia]|uniref:hypothetical protein n=1 Tax=Halovenus halobia TaxID=3396622 RepID=UPI003F56A51A